MKKRFVIGYILLNIGIIMGAILVIINLIQNIILKLDPEAFYAGMFIMFIETGLTWLLFIIPGSILVRKHEQLFKKNHRHNYNFTWTWNYSNFGCCLP
jgi:hypothetical protein